jgi:hypothetical protein
VNFNRTAVTRQPDVADAVAELRTGLHGGAPRLVVFFASPAYPPQALAHAMERAFAPAAVIGCTTAGEIISGALLKRSIVAMALDTVGDVEVQVVQGLGAGASLEGAFRGFDQHFGRPTSELDPLRHVGLVLIDGVSGAEEELMDELATRTHLAFVGGSAGDDLAFRQTWVFAQGRAFCDAAVLALLRVDRGFAIVKTQSFEPTGRTLVATRVDAPDRTVLEFDGRPAAEAYAAALGVPQGQLAGEFTSHPLGVMVGNEPYVRSPQRVVGTAVRFYGAIHEGMELEVLRATDILDSTRRALHSQLGALGGVAGIVDFDCILRTLELEKKSEADAYGRLFSGVPTVGFSTYGEAYLAHVNQTATMLALR